LQAQAKKDATNTNTGLQFIKSKLENGFCIPWKCGACREKIEIFTGNNGFEKIKSYLKQFDERKFLPCPKRISKHLNWFEIKETQIIWHTQASFDTEIQSLKS
jgi:hypothetical protein